MYCLSPASSEGVGAPRSDIMLDWARELTLEIKLYYTPLKFKMKVVEAETVRSLLERVGATFHIHFPLIRQTG